MADVESSIKEFCPHCGGEAGVFIGGDKKQKTYYVECGICFCRTSEYGTPEEAVKMWDMRFKEL